VTEKQRSDSRKGVADLQMAILLRSHFAVKAKFRAEAVILPHKKQETFLHEDFNFKEA